MSFRAFFRLRPFLLGYLILALGTGAMYINGQQSATAARSAIIESGRAITVEGCNRDFRLITSVRQILVDAQAITRERQAIDVQTADRLRQAEAFYERQLSNLKLPDCKAAMETLNDDPNESTRIPAPLRPSGKP